MAGQNSSNGSPNINELLNCEVNLVASFEKNMEESLWSVNAMLLSSVVLAGVIVGIGVYGQRYRHHRFTRFIFFGATTLFLPIISTVVSMSAGFHDYIMDDYWNSSITRLIAKCQPRRHSILVVTWASLVQIIIINCSTVVAVDEREGGNVGPPFQLLVQGVWTFYLGVNYAIYYGIYAIEDRIGVSLEAASFALTCAKMVLKYYAYEKARQSFALGRNPHLICGYMQQPLLQETSQQGEPATVAEDAPPPPPPLLVMGEERRRVEKQPHGYVIKDDSGSMLHKSNGLVTIDRVWKLDSMSSTVNRMKDLCLSFALFKLLRCRLARYKLSSARYNDTVSFFWSLLLKDGGHDRVFRVISDELSFIHDYYYSSLPISYSKSWLPIVGIFISVLSIAYCIFAAVITLTSLAVGQGKYHQIKCTITCTKHHLESEMWGKSYGSWYFDLVPIFLLLVLAVVSEVRDIASYIFSSWTKVALMCRLLKQTTSQHSLPKNKWISLLSRRRCKMMSHWDEKMGQCLILGLQPRTNPLVFLWRLLRLPDKKTKVKVPEVVKVSIIRELRRSKNGCLSNGTSSLRRSLGDNFLWACNNKGTSDTILTWHIATSILEVRYPNRHDQGQVPPPTCNSNDDKIVATHLSRYCAYLVTWCPELLLDNDAWSKSLYDEVKREVEPALTSHIASAAMLTPLAEYEKLVDLLSASAKHEVLKNGVRLGKELAELIEDEEAAWKLLAGFWSEMILYVALSDNLKGHLEAIARGGELITLLWALLTHAGIVSRPGEDRCPDAAGVTATTV